MPSGRLPGACWMSLVFLLLIGCLLPAGVHGQYSLRFEPQDLVVPDGGSISVNCSTDCPHPQSFHLETFLPKKSLGQGSRWAAFQLSNVTNDSQILCSSFCYSFQLSTSSNITVYRFPDRVELAPLPPWQPVGENLTLSCQVAGGAPRASLTVVLLRGEEELSRQPAVGEATQVNATVLARREDHGANFSCRTELDLRPRGLGLFQNSSAPRQLRTFALPMRPPRLDVPRFLVGTSCQANCTLDGLFPASEAQVELALGDQTLNHTVERRKDSITATATSTWSAEQEGTREIVCTVTLGGETRETRENVTFYSFQGPILNLSELSAPEGTTVTVTCAAGSRVQVTLDGAPAVALGQPAQLQLNTTETDDKRRFFCNATLKVDGMTLYRNTSVQLRVLYGPKIDRAKCPKRLKWKDNTNHILECQARGNPDPHLRCVHQRSQLEVPVGTPFLVTLNYSGTYLCNAASSRGTYNLTVVMRVQDSNSAVVALMVALVILGLVTVLTALLYVFVIKRQSDTYQVNPRSPTWLPLRSRQPDQAGGEEPS
ncbi:intercellular adhesion molecule 3 [Diceros bicornis minor]|uniref:intercellular adhesion molecule 3 n=1 Tax=Diceros bicornis minor TaxID=77932 RepID=UPI0026F1F1E8|nr:intercellular adhesion molecule 3 [Diceros bicornis minor]